MGESNRGIVQSIMGQLQKNFSSANKALKFLRKQGLGYRIQDFYEDWRRHLGYERMKSSWKHTTWNHKISERFFKRTTANFKRKYIYTVNVHGFSDILGVEMDRSIYVESDKNLTVGQVIREARKAVSAGRDRYMFEFRSAKIIDIQMRE